MCTSSPSGDLQSKVCVKHSAGIFWCTTVMEGEATGSTEVALKLLVVLDAAVMATVTEEEEGLSPAST